MTNLADKLRYLVQIGGRSSFVLISRRILGKKSRYFRKYQNYFKGRGIEIAGPSSVFKGNRYFPIYSIAASLDNVNYSARTRWHGDMGEGGNFVFDPNRRAGKQIINEAGELTEVASKAYDFLISNHMLEHSANPIKVLFEWKRVVRDDGILLIVLPHKDGTFDHLRPLTTLQHLIEDYQGNMAENDTTHIPEILELHDFRRDFSNPNFEKLTEWMSNNRETRGAHQHVFNGLVAAQMVDYAGYEILDIEISLPSDIFIILKNRPTTEIFRNDAFLDNKAKFLEVSPFLSDKY